MTLKLIGLKLEITEREISRKWCRNESFYTTGKQKKFDCFYVDGYSNHGKTLSEAMGCYYHFCSCKEIRPSLSEQDIDREKKKREMDELKREYIRKGGNNKSKCESVSRGSILKQIL